MVKHAQSLTIPKKLKDSPDFLCEGFHLVAEAFKSRLKIRFVFATEKALARPEALVITRSAEIEKVKIFIVPDPVIGYLSETAAPQGIVAVAGKPLPRRPENVRSSVLALHQIQDPGNVGTLLRSAEAFGAEGVFLTEGCCDPFNPKVVRASMGSLFRIPYEFGLDWKGCMEWARSQGLLTVALDGNSEKTLADLPTDKPLLFWLGAEGQGLPMELKTACDFKVKIRMAGSVESLNVAVAGSLALYYKGFRRTLS